MTATQERDVVDAWTGRREAIDAFLLLLAKAMRQMHTYPVTSPVCVDALNACRMHLAGIESLDEVKVTMTPDGLQILDHPAAESAIVRQELVRPLRRAGVSSVSFQRECTTRDLTRFCLNLLRCTEVAERRLVLAALMEEDGVSALIVEMSARRAVLPVAPSAPAQRELIAHERRRREEVRQPNTRIVHLFPPHRGWIRLDPAESYDAVSLSDLAILVDDPNDLAGLLDRVAEAEQQDPADAHVLERRFGNVASLFAGMEPRLSRVLFGKLARVLFGMEVERRNALLKSTVIPALFDGRPAAKVLYALNDADLAEALCAVHRDNGNAALAISALEQLKLEPERHAAVLGLIDQIVRARIDPALGLDAASAIALNEQALRLTKINANDRRSFAELAGFDFKLGEQGQIQVKAVCDGVRHADGLLVDSLCQVNLIGLQPNPEVATTFATAAAERMNTMVAAGRWSDVVTVLERLAVITASVHERRPEIHALIEQTLVAFATPDVVSAMLAQRAQDGTVDPVAIRFVDALGGAAAPALLSLLDANSQVSSAAVDLMCERASLFAPMLVNALDSASDRSRAFAARVFGHAGSGYEDHLARLCSGKDEKTTREALRALSRIGTSRAAELLGVLAQDARDARCVAIVEALLRFTPETGGAGIRDVLANKSFVRAQPAEASRLIGRVAGSRIPELEPVLREIWSLRFRFWNRALVDTARRAGEALKR